MVGGADAERHREAEGAGGVGEGLDPLFLRRAGTVQELRLP